MNEEWISVKDVPIDLSDTDNIAVSYDGVNEDDSVSYMYERTCMLAGSAGGHGYFGAGWGTNGNSGCDKGLICDEPTHWKYINQPNKN